MTGEGHTSDEAAAMVILAKLPISIPGYRPDTIKAARDHLVAALAAAYRQGYAHADKGLFPRYGGDFR